MNSCQICAITVKMNTTGANPGFLVERGADPRGRHEHTILPKFPKKLHLIEKFLRRRGRGGGGRGALDLPIHYVIITSHQSKFFTPFNCNYQQWLMWLFPEIEGIRADML